MSTFSKSALDKAKEILIDDVFGGQRLSQIKRRVRLSVDLRLISPSGEQEKDSGSRKHSLLSNHSQTSSSLKRNISEEHETLGDLLKNFHSSRNSENSSVSQKSFTTIPKFVLENINDKNLVLKHSTHRIDIEIINLVFCENSSLLTKANANFLYIEYSFLNYKGHLLETQALPRPKRPEEKIFYHFNNSFDIRPSEDKKQFKLLKRMLEENSKFPIKFLIVSEPVENQDQEDGECEEVG